MKIMKPDRILYICGGIMNRGGIESYMMNYYRHIDRNKIQIDFIVHGNQKGVYDDEIEELGGKIYHVPVKSKDYFGNIRALKKIFNSGEYKIVHSHMDAMNMVVLKTARKCGVPIRISHSHNTKHLTSNPIKVLMNEYARKNVSRYATHLFACSSLAGEWLYGKKNIDQGKVLLINNAIEVAKYQFSESSRNEMRSKLPILDDEIVIGHVGRFDYQKNHSFLLDVFKEYININPKCKLVLVGEGHLKENIINKIQNLGISDNVILAGTTDKVENYLNLFDVFVFPSLFEGLGIVLIEAQANGLPCIVSDTVPSESNVTGSISYLSLKDDIKHWANEIENKRKVRSKQFNALTQYDIDKEANKLQAIYLDMLGSKMK